MPRYFVEMTVAFSGEIEADSESEAERLAIYDKTVMYDAVDDISVSEIEEYDEEEIEQVFE